MEKLASCINKIQTLHNILASPLFPGELWLGSFGAVSVICGWRVQLQGFSTWTQAISQRKEQVGLFCHIGTAQSHVKTFLWFWQLSEKHSEEIGTVKNSAAIISVPYIYIFMYAYIFKNCIKAVTGLLLKKKKKDTLKRFTVQLETCVWILLQQISEQEVSHYV